MKKNEKFGSEVFTESKVTTVVLPASIEVIESRAFYNCQNLENVTFVSGKAQSDKTCQINSEAFRQCKKMTKTVLPTDKELEIEKGAFLKCGKLASVAEPQTEGENAIDFNGTFPATLS